MARARVVLCIDRMMNESGSHTKMEPQINTDEHR